MSTTPATRSVHGAPYAPPARAALLSEGLQCIVAGRPLPEALRPAAVSFPAVATVADGIAHILAGPGAHRPG